MVETLIYESKKSKIYKLDENEWNKPVLLKILNYDFPTPLDIAQFYNEYEIIIDLKLTGVRKPLQRGKYNGRHCMYLEWIEGQTLREAFKDKQNDIRDFLYLAISMTKVLGELHQQNIIHKDINPNNLLVNLQERHVNLISFGIASKINLKESYLGNPEHLEGTLAYISPEQTGRMNRVVDYRTDLYSLGITFYEMLSGNTPFKAKDAIEMVHCHLATHPTPLYKVNPNVPKTISDIVNLLLSKKSEERYQSVSGLRYDLEHCLKLLEGSGQIGSFPLQKQDYSGKFTLPQKLYGRDTELATILKRFEFTTQGSLELVLVAGYSGTGKSALVHEVHKPITEKRGYFIEGKFDQYQRAVPYYAILQAFNNFIDILLTENNDSLDEIRKLIQSAVGEEGKVLTDLLPALELIIGHQRDIPDLGGSELQNRFNYVFRKFVNTLSSAKHPMVLFIDDLQWADSSSLSLLKTLITDKNNSHLLCIGAYRDNEVSASHPLMISVEDMRSEGANIFELSIGNLPKKNVNQLISDALGMPIEKCKDISDLVFEKTHGNAFFVTEFLKSLYEEGFLFFNYDEKCWAYSLKKINEQNISDNVVELIASRAKKLDEEVRETLKLASAIGNSFNLDMLSLISSQDTSQTRKNLQPALAESLIIPNGNNYKFAHDRIQQAVYSLIRIEDRDKTHLRIGRLLWKDTQNEKFEEYLFDIVNHLNLGIHLITDEKEKEKLCQLNLKAGIKAKESSAFKLAYDYLETGINLLKENAWESQYKTCLQLHALAGETAYLNGDFILMDSQISLVLENAPELMDKIESYGIRILAFKAQNKLLEAIDTGRELLAQLGETFPKNPKLPHVMFDLIKTKIKLYGKNNDKLENLPEMTDVKKIAAMRIIADIASSSYWATPNLFPLIIFRMVNLSLKYGNTALSAFGFASYGVIMCGVLGDMKSGYQFGKLGLILLEKFNAKEWKAQIFTPIYCLIVNWNEHIDKTLKPLQDSYHIGLETGAIEFACINTNIYGIHAYLSGKRLKRLEVEMKAYSESFAQFKQETNFNYNEVYRQSLLNLMGRSTNPTLLIGEAYDEEIRVLQNTERNDQTGTFFIHFNKLILCYIFGDYKNAKKHAEESRKLLESVLAKFEIPNHHFYEALSLLALYPNATSSEKKKYMGRVKKNVRQMKKWAKDAPENFQHKYELMKAEKMRVLGKWNNAGILYDEAIKGASKNDFINEEAIAHELAGKFYLRKGSNNLAEYYLKDSYNAYREWGAIAKLRSLEQEFPIYISSILGTQNYSSDLGTQTSESTKTTPALLDINAVIKASATLAREIVLDKLLNTLIKIVMENAGADRGILLLEKDEKFLIQALSNDSGKNTEVLQSLDYNGIGILAESIVSYVIHSKKSIVVQDAQNDLRYIKDDYIKKGGLQSAICLPIIQRGNLNGILYLENNLATRVFTQDRIELLSLLSGQIAVSIENAMLYESMEQKVKERTKELVEEKRKSDELLLNILPAEIAEELKSKGTIVPKKFDKVSVMFTDFEGFTKLSEKLTPEELVTEIDTCFSTFDRIINKHKLEKIKTIGDSYMCVGGLPVPNSTHAIDTVNAGLEIIDYMYHYRKDCIANGKPVLKIRVGIHTGPVIAGVVGSTKFAFDIWGDTVNTASRMEQSGEVSKLNVSGSTYDAIKDKYNCNYRGKVFAKNKGEIDMFFVERK